MKRERVILGLLVALVLAACGTTASSGGSSYQGKTIKLGAILSITGAGGVYGPQSRDGMMLAVDEINKAGGLRFRSRCVTTPPIRPNRPSRRRP